MLASQVATTLRTITNGSEHMFKGALEMHIVASYQPISFPLKMIKQIPIVPGKIKRQKRFRHLSSPLKRRVWDQYPKREWGLEE